MTPRLKNPRNIYLITILTVIVLTISIQIITQYSLNVLHRKTEVIGFSSDIMLLSQRAAKLALRMNEAPYETAKAELIQIKQTWDQKYLALKTASSAMHLSPTFRRKVDMHMQSIQPHYDSISSAMTVLINSPSPDDRLKAIAAIQHQEKVFFPLINEVVEEWKKISIQGLTTVRLIEIALAAISMLILFLELFFIMLPAFRKLMDKNKALKTAYEEQETLNEELRATQEELTQSLEYQIDISAKLEKAKLKADEASQAKEQFLSTMSHEIRTPMNAVIGLTHLLLEDNPKASQLENLEALKFSGDSLLSLINDILDYSKIEAGKIELEETQINLASLFRGIQKSLGVNASEKKITLNTHISDDIPQGLLGDPTRLAQVLNNLVSNAIKFTIHGEVSLKAKLVHRTQDTVDITFSVQDTGIGIPEDKLDDIFQSFTQASKDTSRKFGGTGLGLAISKKLLEIQQSQLNVVSKVGEGSTFTFSLTFKYVEGENVEEKSPVKKKEHSLSLSGNKLLVAEDNILNIIVIQQFLKKWNIEFQIVENGKLAVEALRSGYFDLILMDLQMPEMDGFTASKTIRTFNQTIPIIALTASASLEVQQEVYEAGMNDFASKPFVPSELYQKIEKYTGVTLS